MKKIKLPPQTDFNDDFEKELRKKRMEARRMKKILLEKNAERRRRYLKA